MISTANQNCAQVKAVDSSRSLQSIQDNCCPLPQTIQDDLWQWTGGCIGWSLSENATTETAVVLIHGFGANTRHWRNNQPVLGEHISCYAVDLLGFGRSDQPMAQLPGEPDNPKGVTYGFDLWGEQIRTFCQTIVQRPVVLVGNSIGGVVALRAAQLLGPELCCGVVLIDCAQRLMDDKQLSKQPAWMAWIARASRPWCVNAGSAPRCFAMPPVPH